MKRLDIVPLVGVGDVRFGMQRDQVRAAMGDAFEESFVKGGSEVDGFYPGSPMHVFYSAQGKVVFIECFEDDGVSFLVGGEDVLHCERDEARAAIARAGSKQAHEADDETLVFRDLELALGGDDDEHYSSVAVGAVGYFGTG